MGFVSITFLSLRLTLLLLMFVAASARIIQRRFAPVELPVLEEENDHGFGWKKNVGEDGIKPGSRSISEEVLPQQGRVPRWRELQERPSCPLDFTGLKDFPWFVRSCQKPGSSSGNSTCCGALLYGLGLAEAEYVRTAGQFRLKDTETVGACFADMKVQLESDGLENSSVVDVCFPPTSYDEYVSHPTNCAGIITESDFYDRIGSTRNITLGASCSGDLNIIERCSVCVSAMRDVSTYLATLTPNFTDCLYYTLWYSAGISNEMGPYASGTADCIMAVDLLRDGQGNNDVGLYVGIPVGVGVPLLLLATVGSYLVWWKRRKDRRSREFVDRHKAILASRPNIGMVQYEYKVMKMATDDFAPRNFLGAGGFGDVYKGKLSNGKEVAVKRMKNCSAQGDSEFINEVEVINSIRHRNLVVLRGCCVSSDMVDGPQRLLVYDYLPNGTLHDHLFGNLSVLTWPQRRRLAIGIAKGICYLHNDTSPPIIHRDIKSSNILLDENMEAKVADFGLARFSAEGDTHVTTAVAGTRGYLAPEYAIYGQLTDKSDVYSFGVVLLELLSSQPAISSSKHGMQQITDWAWSMVRNDKVMDILSETIREEGLPDEMRNYVLVGILCSHMLAARRPSMAEVVKYLEGDATIPDIPDRPLPLNSPREWSGGLDCSQLFPDLKSSSSVSLSSLIPSVAEAR